MCWSAHPYLFDPPAVVIAITDVLEAVAKKSPLLAR